MPIVDLDQRQSFALLAEMTSTRNLLSYCIRAVRTGAFIETTRDPILTMLSIGVEKLYKLTLGVAALERDHTWPTAKEMKGNGHKLSEMHATVISELQARTANTTDYVQGLLAEVETDSLIPPLIAALDMYGRMGRFYYLDQLGDRPQAWESPDAYWQSIESAALREPPLAEMYKTALVDPADNRSWDVLDTALKERIASAIEGLWVLIAVSARHHAFGEIGVVLGFEVHPEAVGRQ